MVGTRETLQDLKLFLGYGRGPHEGLEDLKSINSAKRRQMPAQSHSSVCNDKGPRGESRVVDLTQYMWHNQAQIGLHLKTWESGRVICTDGLSWHHGSCRKKMRTRSEHRAAPKYGAHYVCQLQAFCVNSLPVQQLHRNRIIYSVLCDRLCSLRPRFLKLFIIARMLLYITKS